MRGVPMVWAPVHTAWNYETVISPWIGQGAGASRLLRRKVSELSIPRGIPADASGASWPCPQTNESDCYWTDDFDILSFGIRSPGI